MKCHEDQHEGKYGLDCSKCHNEESFLSFNDLSSFDHTVADFNLEGKHLGVDCKKCHVEVMQDIAKEQKIDLDVSKIKSAENAQNAPTGFGVFNILKDDKRIEDHYISKRRFETLLEKNK